MTTDIAVPAQISPAQFDADIAAAQHKAMTLKSIVDSQGLSVKIGPSEHLKVEAWLTIAAGYGYSPRIAWSRALGGGGFEARAELADTLGTVIAAGEAECGTEGDDNWLDKPAFQQRSMAQTRATVKACRAKLAWVVVLAGYSPTPAEEMHDGPQLPTGGKPIPVEFLCPIHKAEWFKRGNMRGFAHPIGEKDAQGRYGAWCNRSDVQKSSEEPAFIPEAQPAPAGPQEAPVAKEPSAFKSKGDLLNYALKLGLSKAQVVATLKGQGVDFEHDLNLEADLAKAGTILSAMHGPAK